MSVNFICDLSAEAARLERFWEHTIGSGHAPLALRADWQRQMKKAREELGFHYVRFHGILSYPMDTLIIHNDEFLYSFFNADQIYDYLLSIGMKPFIELSFMPLALSSGGKTVFHYQSNVTPPKNYQDWARLISKFVRHLVERYGIEEVRTWYFEVWNEPNIKHFWSGDRESYFTLYKYTVEAIKEIDAGLRVGGPATAKNEWIEEFVDFCKKNDLPADFVSTHHYPTDAFGAEGDDTIDMLAKARRSVLREQTQDAYRRARGKPLLYTEWNASSNPRDELHDQSYAAAFVTKTIMEARGLVEAYSFWTFTDIFEENYFPSKPFHGGFGLMNIHGIPKPTYRAYQLLHELDAEILPVDGLHITLDAWATRGENAATVLMTNHALPRHLIETEKVRVTLRNASGYASANVKKIDEHNANPKRLWQEMGEPEYLSAEQIEQLKSASQLIEEPLSCDYNENTSEISFDIEMPPQSVASVKIKFQHNKNLNR